MQRFLLVFTLLVLFSCNRQSTTTDRPLKPPKGYLNESLLKLSYGVGWLDLIETDDLEVPVHIQEYKNITYKEIDSTQLQLDIYKKKSLKEPRPALIFIHGGSWSGGKRGDYLPYLISYANKDYVTATISYRLIRQAKFPAAAQDVNCGINWILEHAEDYGIDPERVGVVGGSAGGHLGMLVGYGDQETLFDQDCEVVTDRQIKAIVNFYGPVDLTTPYATGTYQVQNFLNVTYEEDPKIYRTASPSTYISSDDPPTLTFHGTIDSLVPVSQADSLDMWLEQAGVPHDYHRLKGWPHSMDVARKVNEYCQFYIDRFLEEHL